MNKLKLTGLAFAAALFTLSCNKQPESADANQQEPATEQTTTEKSLSYDILPKSGSDVAGTVTFNQDGDNVTMTVNASGLTPGEHGIHIHETADCSADDATSTGGHWNPASDDHGKWDAEHFHMGDIGNLTADEDGNAQLTFTTDKWCLGCEDASKNIMDKGLIIHADADDFETQPTGNAGGRIGCVEIK